MTRSLACSHVVKAEPWAEPCPHYAPGALGAVRRGGLRVRPAGGARPALPASHPPATSKYTTGRGNVKALAGDAADPQKGWWTEKSRKNKTHQS